MSQGTSDSCNAVPFCTSCSTSQAETVSFPLAMSDPDQLTATSSFPAQVPVRSHAAAASADCAASMLAASAMDDPSS